VNKEAVLGIKKGKYIKFEFGEMMRWLELQNVRVKIDE